MSNGDAAGPRLAVRPCRRPATRAPYAMRLGLDPVCTLEESRHAELPDIEALAARSTLVVLRFPHGGQVELGIMLDLGDVDDFDRDAVAEARATAWRSGSTLFRHSIDGSPARVVAVLEALADDIGPIIVWAPWEGPVLVARGEAWIDRVR